MNKSSVLTGVLVTSLLLTACGGSQAASQSASSPSSAPAAASEASAPESVLSAAPETESATDAAANSAATDSAAADAAGSDATAPAGTDSTAAASDASSTTADGAPSTGALWQYTYAGVEHPYLTAISEYLVAFDAENLEIKDGMIPVITSIEIDNEDPSDIKMWGIFDINNFTLADKTLTADNSERLLGLMHLAQAEDGSCTVTNAEFVLEGDTGAIEALCDGHEMALKGLTNPFVTEETRRWYISQFVAAEGLDADSYCMTDGKVLPLAYTAQASPDWVAELPEASEVNSLIVVDITIGSNARLTMHEKDAEGIWQQTLDEAAFIGKNGAEKTREGDTKTPLGTFGFNAALGILDDPGCAIPYTKVDDSHYWDADSNSAHYNTLVSTNDYTDFSIEDSEHIVDYPNAYKYILNTTYNEEQTPMKGSAIFLHCYREERTYTGGCISIPLDKMEYVMTHVQPDTKIIIRYMPE